MKSYAVTSLVALSSVAALACSSEDQAEQAATSSQPLTGSQMLEPRTNDHGSVQTATTSGTIDTNNAFFASLGTNGRSCASCHVADAAWTISPAGLQKRFDATGGLDPVFLRTDGADSPTAAVGTVAERRAASSNLLSRGTIRVGLPKTRPTATWDIDIEQIADPRNSNALTATNGQVSFFRRPLPVANLRFTAAINWDGRNTPDLANMRPGLLNQSNGATTGHAQGAALNDATRAAIVDFELGLYTAQVKHDVAGNLTSAEALGGPLPLVTQPFAIGTSGAPAVFTIFDAWNDREDDGLNTGRADVAAGQRIFNEKKFGPNGDRTCSGCHAAPNVGSGTRFAFFDVGVSDAGRWNGNVPLYRVRQRSNPANVVETTDPGRAMITGQFADVNKFKVPGLRGLSARPPYFHDGSAATIADVVDHYEARFSIAFEGAEKRQLVTFLESL
jgi:cytochrome c peroxidase